MLEQQAAAAQAKAEAAAAQSDELRGALAEARGEVENLTMALQQAILEQKGVAESKKKWKTKA